MSSDGTYSSRGSRRADRGAPAAKRASAGAAAAILIIMALTGFGGGALLGNASGEDPQTPVAETPDETSGTDEPDESPSPDDEETVAADGTITAHSSFHDGEAIAADGGDCRDCDLIDLTVEAPSLAGETLWLERSLDGGETWEQFGTSPRSVTLNGNGSGSDQIFSGRPGENQFRYVLRDGDEIVQESNVIVVELVPQG